MNSNSDKWYYNTKEESDYCWFDYLRSIFGIFKFIQLVTLDSTILTVVRVNTWQTSVAWLESM